jgi:ABC-type branched-subunit amino acid transport system substrate-binding protein
LLPGSTTDFAPYAQKLREASADSVMFINSVGVSGGVMRTATSFGLKPLWAHNSGSMGEAEAQQIGAPAEGMLVASVLPSFRDTSYAGVRRWVAEMKAAGKDDPGLMKPSGENAWLAVYAVAAVAKTIQGNINNVALLAALRKQTRPIDLFGLATFAPGKRGPAAFPRWTSIKTYFETVRNGQVVSWGNQLPPVFPLVLQHFVR